MSEHYRKYTFVVDKYESQSSAVFNYTNLGILLDNTERSNSLRSVIIDKQTPKFSDNLPKIIVTRGTTILKDLNKIQKKVALRALTMDKCILIKGLPGTGKPLN